LIGLYEDLIESVKEKQNAKIHAVRVGVTWTGVLTEKVGLSLTYSSVSDKIEDGGTLKGKTSLEVLEYLKTFNFLKLAVGLATLNSLIDIPKEFETLNILDHIEEIARDKRVVFVGHFCGLDKIKRNAKELIILERNPQEGDLIDTAADYVIPEADVVAITGSTIANKSIEHILKLSKGYTIVFGPSTPMSPVLFDYGVDLIGGSVVLDNNKVMNAISEGGDLSNFKKYLKYIAIKRN
jgi:uncharacterized protein (DUF4213/DUF364 family)